MRNVVFVGSGHRACIKSWCNQRVPGAPAIQVPAATGPPMAHTFFGMAGVMVAEVLTSDRSGISKPVAGHVWVEPRTGESNDCHSGANPGSNQPTTPFCRPRPMAHADRSIALWNFGTFGRSRPPSIDRAMPWSDTSPRTTEKGISSNFEPRVSLCAKASDGCSHRGTARTQGSSVLYTVDRRQASAHRGKPAARVSKILAQWRMRYRARRICSCLSSHRRKRHLCSNHRPNEVHEYVRLMKNTTVRDCIVQIHYNMSPFYRVPVHWVPVVTRILSYVITIFHSVRLCTSKQTNAQLLLCHKFSSIASAPFIPLASIFDI
jgi:hypothetical protein